MSTLSARSAFGILELEGVCFGLEGQLEVRMKAKGLEGLARS